MNQPTPDPAAAAAPSGSVFTPQPAAAPPPPPAAEPPPAPLSHAEIAYGLLGRYHGIQGRLELLGRRLSELLAGHAALVAHVVNSAPAAATATPGGTAFWGQVLDQHQAIHGLLKAAETEAARLLEAHGAELGVLEQVL